MKIVHIAPNSYPFLGGIEILLKNFTKFVHGDPNFQHLITFPDRSHKFDGSFKVEGTQVVPLKVLKQKYELPYFPKPNYHPIEIAHIFALYKDFLMKEKPDVLHFHDFSEASLPMLSIARSSGIKRVHHIHTLVSSIFPNDLIKNLSLEKNFIAVSKAVSRSIQSEINPTLNPNVISNGLPEISSEQQILAQAEYPTILMVGRCVPSKGFEIGIRVFREILTYEPKAKLIIAGFGTLFNSLKRQVERLEISESVEFIRGPHPTEVQKLMMKSWIVFTPSQSQEGFNLVAAEAGLCGRAVVATDVGGLPETVIHQQTGLVIDHGNEFSMKQAILSLIRDEKRRTNLGEAARVYARANFSMERFASDLNKFYRELE